MKLKARNCRGTCLAAWCASLVLGRQHAVQERNATPPAPAARPKNGGVTCPITAAHRVNDHDMRLCRDASHPCWPQLKLDRTWVCKPRSRFARGWSWLVAVTVPPRRRASRRPSPSCALLPRVMRTWRPTSAGWSRCASSSPDRSRSWSTTGCTAPTPTPCAHAARRADHEEGRRPGT
jgi:hypothetical protein